MSKVVIVHSKRKRNQQIMMDNRKIKLMFIRGLSLLAGQDSLNSGIRRLLGKRVKIGIKINTIGGRKISTQPKTSLALAAILTECGTNEKDIIIWDRTNRELREAGYRLNMSGSGIKVIGTDSQSIGYNPSLYSHLNIGSLFSSIQADHISRSISLAILKDHGLAGVTAGMKNYFGAVHNPNKYHDNRCNPFVAELFDTPVIKNKHMLTILDALTVQYHRGPSFHAQWADNYGALIFSQDPVAADRIGWQIIDKLRAGKGLPSLNEEKREPVYLYTAEQMGLGKSNLETIQIIETEI